MRLLWLILFLPFVALSQVRQNLILDNGFDGSNPFYGFTLVDQQYCCSYSINQVVNPQGAGSVLRYELHSSDPIVSSSKRAEIQLAGTDAPEYSDRWYGLRYYLYNYGADPGAESIIQWHDVNGTCPPMTLQIQNGRLRWTQCINNSNTHNDLGPVTSNQWFDIVIHIRWASDNTGILQVWRNGTLMVNKTALRTNSTGGSYFKLGINKWSWAPPLIGSSNQQLRIFFIDEFRYGNENATYQDVVPTPFIVTSVTWGYFKYNEDLVCLQWSTLSEENNDHFEIEESEDGIHWNIIASIPSQAIDGNSITTLQYSYKL